MSALYCLNSDVAVAGAREHLTGCRRGRLHRAAVAPGEAAGAGKIRSMEHSSRCPIAHRMKGLHAQLPGHCPNGRPRRFWRAAARRFGRSQLAASAAACPGHTATRQRSGCVAGTRLGVTTHTSSQERPIIGSTLSYCRQSAAPATRCTIDTLGALARARIARITVSRQEPEYFHCPGGAGRMAGCEYRREPHRREETNEYELMTRPQERQPRSLLRLAALATSPEPVGSDILRTRLEAAR